MGQMYHWAAKRACIACNQPVLLTPSRCAPLNHTEHLDWVALTEREEHDEEGLAEMLALGKR